MRTTILISLCLIVSFYCTAQKQGNIWVFGYDAGVDFNTSPPGKISTGAGSSGGHEGTSCISDSAGRFLFWSDGIDAFGPHGLLVNGSGLVGDRSSMQGSIIVPKPGSDSLFYLITSDAAEPYFYKVKPHGYNYSVVNMCLGWKNKDTILGGIIAGQKNIHLVDSGTEKLCVTSDGNNGYWILGHKGFSDAFVAWHLTGAGLSVPVVTHIGPQMGVASGGNVYGIGGQMKFNVAGTKVAAVTQRSVGTSSTLDLFDFDPLTGKLSNHCQNVISSLTNVTPNGVEFSPDGSKVYITYTAGSSLTYVGQNTMNSNCGLIGQSRDTVFVRNRTGYLRGIQTGPDGQLYVGYDDGVFNKTELHRINNPNGIPSYDTGVFTFFKQTGISTFPPSLIAGYKYHNKLCKCSQPLAVPTVSAAIGEVRVFPNPANEFINISASGERASILGLLITDAVGRLIYQSATLPVKVDLQKHAVGIYFFRIFNNNGVENAGKFIIVRQ